MTAISAPGIITIDLDALAGNWRALARLVAPAQCGAVVKADAYGLGVSRVAPALWTAGCRTFFVATTAEAHEVRTLAPKSEIFVLDGLMPGGADGLLSASAQPVLSSLPEVREWAAAGRQTGKPLACALHLDSGLNRLGLADGEVRALASEPELLNALDVRLVMSHLACADDPADPKNEDQRRRFDELQSILPDGIGRSLAASDGLMLGKAYHYDLVRPGYALYGGQAFRGGPTPVKPVVGVQARILQVRDVAPGETVGYAASWRATRPSRIAILAAGYADGFMRSGSSPGAHDGAVVEIAGMLCPIAGRISMDLITVDVTDVQPTPQRGSLAGLVCPQIPLEAMGQRAGTIGYEVLTSLSRRFHRTYIGSGS